MTNVKTKITIWHERNLRESAIYNHKLKYLNIQLLGLSGRPHPAIHFLNTTQDVRKARAHIKFLISDYAGAHSNEPFCPQCHLPQDCMTEHIIAKCSKYNELRQRILPDLLNTVYTVYPNCAILVSRPSHILTQFVLDCTSMNLSSEYRIPSCVPGLYDIFCRTRDLCFAISNMRTRLMK